MVQGLSEWLLSQIEVGKEMHIKILIKVISKVHIQTRGQIKKKR